MGCLILQARMPSYHVCLTFELPEAPQLPNQEPPRPQQLILPDFGVVLHLVHVEPIVVVVTTNVRIRRMVEITKRTIQPHVTQAVTI